MRAYNGYRPQYDNAPSFLDGWSPQEDDDWTTFYTSSVAPLVSCRLSIPTPDPPNLQALSLGSPLPCRVSLLPHRGLDEIETRHRRCRRSRSA